MTGAPASPPVRICAVILFTHRYERNLPLLEQLYADRFPHRHVIMPFARTPGPGMSRVFELGRNFSGHLAQAARDFIAPEFTHYLVIADDLLLNPRLDEGNLVAALGLGQDEAYIKNLVAADALRHRWPWAGEAAASFRRFAKAIDLTCELPPAAEAEARFAAMGIAFPRPGPRGVAQTWFRHAGLARKSGWAYMAGLTLRGRPSDYPLLAGYSDFLVIPATAIEAFVHYCGVLAALNVFAEIAIPTALCLAAETVKTEFALNHHFDERPPPLRDGVALRGREFWSAQEMAPYQDLMGGDLAHLLANFPSDWLYVHPVKLSNYQ